MRYITIASICKDTIHFNGRTFYSYGGPHIYCSNLLVAMGASVLSIAACSLYDMDKIKRIINSEVYFIPFDETLEFINTYSSDDGQDRFQSVKKSMNKIRFHHFDSVNISQDDCVIVAPLIDSDIDLAILDNLKMMGCKKIVLAGQGFLRKVINDTIFSKCNVDFKLITQKIDYLFLNKEEATIATGMDKIKDIIEFLNPTETISIIITNGNKGAWIYSRRQVIFIPAFNNITIIDTTGAGETFMAAFLYAVNEDKISIEPGVFAAAVAALSIERQGKVEYNITDVINMIENNPISITKFFL